MKKTSEDIFQYRLGPLKYIIVPVAKDREAFSLKRRIARVVTRRVEMLATVDFDDQPSFEADVVEDETLKWRLPTEFAAR